MPRKSEIIRPTPSMKSQTKPKRRHTYASNDKNTISDLFAFSMHATDPTIDSYFDEILASPTANDMYLDSFHGEDTMHHMSLPLLSLEEDDANDGESSRRASLKRSKSVTKKKKRKSKRLSTESDTSTKSKRKSSKTKKSSKTPEDKSVVAMLKKLEEYEESLQEERRLLQKERSEITLERETLQLKMCELESKLDDLEDNKRSSRASRRSSIRNTNDTLGIENEILKRRLQRQDEIILQLSNSDSSSKEVSRLEKELRRAKELNAKNEKIIKGQKLTIARMRKEASSATEFQVPLVVGTEKKKKRKEKVLNDEDTASICSYTTFAESNLEDSFSSLGLNTSSRQLEKEASSRSLGRIKSWVKRGGSKKESFRKNRRVSAEEAALSSLLDSL